MRAVAEMLKQRMIILGDPVLCFMVTIVTVVRNCCGYTVAADEFRNTLFGLRLQ